MIYHSGAKMNKTKDKDRFIDMLIILCAEHRAKCNDDNCIVNTIFIADFIRKYIPSVSRNQFVDIFRGKDD